MANVTAIILTKNEEINLRDCIMSLRGFAERVVVVDSYSNDRTEDIAKELGADFYQNRFENYSKQFNWAIDNTSIQTKWSLRLDADERMTPELCTELTSIMQEHNDDDVNGVIMEAWLYFLGKKIKHGAHTKRKLMLFKTGIGRIEDRKMDEHTVLSEGKTISSKNRFIHYDFKDMTHWINKMNWYATREMQDYFDYYGGKSQTIDDNHDAINSTRNLKFGLYYKMPLFVRSWMVFVYYYVFRLGFLDGKEGFVFHWMYHRWYRCLVDSKILEQRITGKPFEETGDLK